MTEPIPVIERMGIRKGFPMNPKGYAQRFAKDIEWYFDKLKAAEGGLQRYATEGSFKFSVASWDPNQPATWHDYTRTHALGDLHMVAQSLRAVYIADALHAKSPNWRDHQYRAYAYSCWHYWIGGGYFMIENASSAMAHSMIFGWTDMAIQLARRAYIELDKPRYRLWTREQCGPDFYEVNHWQLRSGVFILKLMTQWLGKPDLWDQTKWFYENPIHNYLLQHWDTPNPADLAPLLLAVCDYRTHQSRIHSRNGHFDFDDPADWYDPYEVLLVLKLRRLKGLANPTLDHILMSTPMAQLPEPTELYSDSLLEGVLARVRLDRPDLLVAI